jgi:hypothetical protein
MKTINSLSGGKTSSFMAVHYPADFNLFSLVTIEDKNCSPNDKILIKKVSDKIGKEFIATVEDDKTLKVIFDLEQLIGNEIIWVAGDSFESIINKKQMLPSSLTRFCTSEMKMRPIWNWWYNNINEKIKMGIGYRWDEMERAERFTSTFKGVVGKSSNGRNKWKDIEWREGYFPLIENKITNLPVKVWANKTNIDFPEDSNCVGCFHKSKQQLRKNFDLNKNKMQWFVNQEIKAKGTWKNGILYQNIEKLGLQLDFNYGGGSGCQGGFCTD